MKRIAKLAIVMVVFSVVSAFGQDRAEIEAKFGQPINAYPVGGSVWMSPLYASDGQVCRMVFYPRQFSPSVTYVGNGLPFDEFRTVIDTVVPIAIRGAQKEPFDNGTWNGGGGVSWTTFVYERVTISYSNSFRIDAKALSSGEPVLLDNDDLKQPEKPEPKKEDFSLYRSSTAEVVTVQWNGRKCPDR